MLSPKKSAVVGGGFRGLAAAYVLATRGDKVTVIDRSPHLGGVLAGPEWHGLALDLGCHLFDNTDEPSTQFFCDMAGGASNFVPIDVQYGNVVNGHRTEGIAVPDLLADQAKKADYLYDLAVAVSAEQAKSSSLSEALITRFGRSLAHTLNPMVAKMYACEPSMLDSTALDAGLFKRVRFLEDDVAALLKQIPAIDERVALPSANRLEHFYPRAAKELPRNFYPKAGGMRGFLNDAVSRLKSMGVEFVLGVTDLRWQDRLHSDALNQQEFDLVVSTLPPAQAEEFFVGSDTLGRLTHKVPMVLFYYLTKSSNLSSTHYCHLFDREQSAFRISSSGKYGGQYTNHGMTYICAECPVTDSAKLWRNPDVFAGAVWEEAKLAGVVDSGDHHDAKIVQTPVSYSAPKRGYADCSIEVNRALEKIGIVNLSSMSFSKLSIVSEIQSELQCA